MVAALRDTIRRRAGDRCEYCPVPQAATPFMPFHIEHVIARQHGGADDADNLALSCDRCNAHKGPNLSAVDPESGGLIELYHPRRDTWQDHFQMQSGVVVGLTARGRATVRLLNMNAPGRVQLRREATRG